MVVTQPPELGELIDGSFAKSNQAQRRKLAAKTVEICRVGLRGIRFRRSGDAIRFQVLHSEISNWERARCKNTDYYTRKTNRLHT